MRDVCHVSPRFQFENNLRHRNSGKSTESMKQHQLQDYIVICSYKKQEITETMENFTKVIKYLIELKEKLINYVRKKSQFKKQ